MKFSPPSAETLSRAIHLVISACRTAFAENLECVTLKGSAVKGDFIWGYSDLDFHVFLKPEDMDGKKAPNLDGAVRFQKAFGAVNPEDFGASQFQIYFLNSEKYPPDWVPPVEGAFKVCWGTLPPVAREADDAPYLHHAEQSLSGIVDSRDKLIERFVDKPNFGVPRIVRLLGATVKSYMHDVLVLQTSKPKDVFKLRLDEMVPLVEDAVGSEGYLSRFFENVSNWPLIRQDPEYARKTFVEGMKALEEIAEWFSRHREETTR